MGLGETVQLAYVDQSRQSLDDSKSVWEEISGGQDIIQVGTYEVPSRAYVGRFNFRGPEQQKKIGLLSGGERNRVHLARTLKAGGNPIQVVLVREQTGWKIDDVRIPLAGAQRSLKIVLGMIVPAAALADADAA